jgi:Domain of unknown function (DUF4062)/NACHT domain
VFLSHTSELREHPPGGSFVAAAEDAVKRAGDAIVDMAYFGAGDVDPAAHCRRMVAESDVYVGIIGLRYGALTGRWRRVSYTEMEFDAATSAGLPRLVFLVDERANPALAAGATARDLARQRAFRRKLQRAGVLTATVATPAGLAAALLQALLAPRTRRRDERTERLDRAAARLAAIVRRQWRDELGLRQMDDPHPLPLRWRRAAAELMDHPEVVLGQPDARSRRRLALSGRSDQVAAAFRRLPTARMVVLGPPGAGKTGLLILLTLGLLEEPRADDPVPVLLSLSSWDPEEEPFLAWAARRLAEDYPALTTPEAFGTGALAELLEERRVLLLLDGLDEMPETRWPDAIGQLNRLRHLPAVVACRREEYERAVRSADVLTGAAVVELEPVRAADAADLLRLAAAPGPRLQRWRPVLARLRSQPAGPLAAALSTPLMVWLARMAYAEPQTNPMELLDEARFGSREAIEGHLLDALLPAVYRRPSLPERWLTFLSRELTRRGTRDLAWWELPAAAPPVLPGALVGGMVAFGLGAGGEPVLGLGCGLLVWLAAGPVFETFVPPPTRVTLRLERGAAGRLLGRVALGLGVGAAIGLVLLLLQIDVYISLSVGLGAGLGLGVSAGVVSMLTPDVEDEAVGPLTTLRTDLVACLLYAGISALATWLTVAFGLLVPPLEAAALVVASGVVASLLTAWPRYQLAHAWLALHGDLPWRLSRFLRDAHRRGVLRRMGSVYQFRHARLQDRLASRGSPSVPPGGASSSGWLRWPTPVR